MPDSAVFFDVDGVLIDSLAAKADAFADLFPSELRDGVRAYHYANGGMNRIEKIAKMSVEIAHVELTNEQVQVLAEEYASVVRTRVVQASEIAGAGDAIRTLRAKYPLHAVSAVPIEELEYVLRERGLLQCFTSIHGVPPVKAQTLHALVKQHGYAPSRCIFVGDSGHDRDAAAETGIPFVFIRSSGQVAPPDAAAALDDLRGLDSLVRELLATR